MRKSLKKSKWSVQKVLDDDELLMKILLHLPPKQIFKCKCVSKRWSAIIADPFFHQSYHARIIKQQLSGAGGRILAFVQTDNIYTPHNGSPSSRPFLNILPVVKRNELKIKPLPNSFGNIVHTSDGLFLGVQSVDFNHTYRVVNPLTRKWVQLTPYRSVDRLRGVGLACKENTGELVPSFKVMGIVSKFGVEKGWDVCTHSHETGRWTTSTLVATEGLTTQLYLKLVCKGVFHWYTVSAKSIVVYNSNRDENCLTTIKLPYLCTTVDNYFVATRSSTDDLLWIGTGYSKWLVPGTGVLNFWKLPIDDYDTYKCATTIPNDHWVLMHTIDCNTLYKEMSLVLKFKKEKIKGAEGGNSHCYIKLEALISSNPVTAVLNLQQKIFIYNLESQSLEFVKYRGRPYGERTVVGWLPFIESLCLSSYGPLVNTI